MRVSACTDIGKTRPQNQDSYYVPSTDKQFFIVADGMGGQKAGSVASKIAVEIMSNYIDEYYNKENDKEGLLKKAVAHTNEIVYRLANENEELKGMGTTVVAALLSDDDIYIVSAGDSRCYLIRNEIISQLTTDNSYVEVLIQRGIITKEEATNHPDKNIITKAIGVEKNIDVDTQRIKAENGDILLLCSDGLTNMVKNEEILEIVLDKHSNLDECVSRLINKAMENGGKDNITVVLVEVQNDGE